MSLDKYPKEFVSTLETMFADVERAAPQHITRLYLIWQAAQNDERRAAFRFMRSQLDRSEDKEGIVQLSWVIGNGTYRTTPNLSKRPWWLDNDEDWKAYTADRLDVKRTGAGVWIVRSRETNEFAGRITKTEEGTYEVWYEPPDPAMIGEVRYFQTYTAAMQDVVARQVMKERGTAQNPQPLSGAV